MLFGSIVYGEYSNCEDCPNPFRSFYTQPQLDTTIIDGIAGRWIKVQYYNLKGYVFSGYILPGHWIIQSEGGVNTDFRLMHSGYQNTALNYDPNLNWYVYDVQEGNCTLRKVDVDIQLWHSHPDHISVYDEHEFSPVRVLVDGIDTWTWLLGTKYSIPDSADQVQFTLEPPLKPFEESYFIYPTQVVYMNTQNHSAYLTAKEIITLNDSFPGGYERLYTVEHGYRNYPGDENTCDLGADLNIQNEASQQRMYATPSLLWVGDINGDHQPDFIMNSGPTRDSYEGCILHILYLSDLSIPCGIRIGSVYNVYFVDNC